MQPKVSIVIPCYNKEDYISKMFDSIIAQNWDNIELILVNDGSTDGTRKIITDYEPKFIKRGFKVIIVDQENRGLTAAVYEGFKRFTGDYVCQVDADDEVESEYVNTMATWLNDHPEYDWVVCDLLYIYEDREVYGSYFTTDLPKKLILSSLPTAFLLKQIRDTVHEYMVRANYIRRCELVKKNYHDKRSRTQESQFFLPLAIAGGKLKHIPKPFYCYHQNEHMISLRENLDDVINYYTDYYDILYMTIEKLDIGCFVKAKFLAMAEIGKYKVILSFAEKFGVYDNSIKSASAEKLLNFLKSAYPSATYWTKELLSDYQLFYRAVIDNVYNIKPNVLDAAYDRIIAWGALGQNGKSILPYLKETALEPTDLWDIAGDGVDVKVPDVESLSDRDLVLVLPVKKFADEICAKLASAKCTMLSYREVWTYICSVRLPKFYDGSIVF